MFLLFMGERFEKNFKEYFHLKTIYVQTFHRGYVDVLPVQTNPLLLIPDEDNIDVGNADEDHHSLQWGKSDGVTLCPIQFLAAPT